MLPTLIHHIRLSAYSRAHNKNSSRSKLSHRGRDVGGVSSSMNGIDNGNTWVQKVLQAERAGILNASIDANYNSKRKEKLTKLLSAVADELDVEDVAAHVPKHSIKDHRDWLHWATQKSLAKSAVGNSSTIASSTIRSNAVSSNTNTDDAEDVDGDIDDYSTSVYSKSNAGNDDDDGTYGDGSYGVYDDDDGDDYGDDYGDDVGRVEDFDIVEDEYGNVFYVKRE